MDAAKAGVSVACTFEAEGFCRDDFYQGVNMSSFCSVQLADRRGWQRQEVASCQRDEGPVSITGRAVGALAIAWVMATSCFSQLCVTPGTVLAGATSSQFGNSISLSANGNTAVVGAWKENNLAGVAYVYVRSGGSWVQQGPALLAGSEAGLSAQFGSSVAISGDGTTILIGASSDNNEIGSAFVFTKSGGAWVRQGGKLQPTGGTGPKQLFGASVALSGDGNTAMVGAWHDNSQVGAVYTFTRSGGVWTQSGPKLVPPSGAGAYFGASVSLSSDGGTSAIGAPLSDRAFVFVRSGSMWSAQGAALVPSGAVGAGGYSFGNSVMLSASGDLLAVGSYSDNRDANGNGLGAAYVFQRSAGTWSQQGPKLVPSITSLRYFGYSVGLSGDGSTLLVGMPGGDGAGGAAFAFVRQGASWIADSPPLSALSGNYGNAVAVNGDGRIALVGAWNDSKTYSYTLAREIEIVQQPTPVVICRSGAAALGVTVSASSPTYRWQREVTPGSDLFANLDNGSTATWDGGVGGAIVFGATTPSLVIAPDLANGKQLSQAHAIRYRCLVENACGSVFSTPAAIDLCETDFNCDGVTDDSDFVSFADAYNLLLCSDAAMPPSCPADLNQDGYVDDVDFVGFATAYEEFGCS